MNTKPVSEMTFEELSEELKNLFLAHHEMNQETAFIKSQQKTLTARINEVTAAFYASYDPSSPNYTID